MSGSPVPYGQREFRCHHCNGRIHIPVDLPPTTGPCPHCGGVITSPVPEPSPVAAQPDYTPAPVVAAAVAPVQPVVHPVVQPVQPEPPRQEVPVQPAPQPAATRAQAPVEEAKPAPQAVKPKKEGGKLGAVLMLLLLLVLLGGGAAFYLLDPLGMRKKVPAPAPGVKAPVATPPADEAEYLRAGWRKDALAVLKGYMSGRTASEKANYVIGGASVTPRIESFFSSGRIDDGDTPADAFSVYELAMEDRKRGLFMMIYDQPPQFEMREFFRPLAPIEVQYGVENADLLLSTVARASNFAMDPVHVHAFFKREPAGLKLDWDLFVQTKYRTLRAFSELPESGKKGVFRVFAVEDVPEKGKAVAGTRTYGFYDPANTEDRVRVNVKVDSEAGSALSAINWRGSKDLSPITRTATIELGWVGDDAPQLQVTRFICWEFLGLGGQDGQPSR